MAIITVQFELGPETRALLERLMGKAAIEVELGERTRDLLDDVVETIERRAGEPARG